MATNSTARRVIFLFDVDNTLLDNDRVVEDLRMYLEREVGAERERCYWAIFERSRSELGYADYLGALQRYRYEYPRDPHLLLVSRFLLDYPFAQRLFPNALNAVAHARPWGLAAILSDGDVVFQPHKIDRSGLAAAVEGRVLIYVHKEQELEDVQQRYPARHYVVVDDKLRILAAIKAAWGPRVTTVFVRQGHYARDRKILADYPPADLAIERIADFPNHDFSRLLKA
jgi:FMN phosphatase YigB (HAD superfamily)